MNKNPRANALKSWTCIVMLTFIVPAGAFEIGNLFFAATAQAGQGLSAYLHSPKRPAETLVITCPGFDGKKVL